MILRQLQKEDSSDDEIGLHSRSHIRGRNGDGHARPEELDVSSLNKDEASKKFRQAEKRMSLSRAYLISVFVSFDTLVASINRTSPCTNSIHIPTIANLFSIRTRLAGPTLASHPQTISFSADSQLKSRS